MKKFKEYEKQYEDVFTSEGALTNCDLSKISNDKGWELSEYMNTFRGFLKETSNMLFNIIIRFHWMQRRFFYNGYQRKKVGWNNFRTDNAFATFTRHYLGMNHSMIISAFYYNKVVSYIENFFPEFDEHNPLKESELYQFPYKNITIDFLTIVYQMPERLELLNIAERENMSYSKFLDYMLNYVSCYNEEHKKDIYTFIYSRACPPYIRYNLDERNEKRIKKLKLS